MVNRRERNLKKLSEGPCTPGPRGHELESEGLRVGKDAKGNIGTLVRAKGKIGEPKQRGERRKSARTRRETRTATDGT